MLRLSKKADYALMAVRHLALQDGLTSTSAREIAEQYDIPIELMAKVLQRLVRTGLLISTQGTRGGYALGRCASLISVLHLPEQRSCCCRRPRDCQPMRVRTTNANLSSAGA